MTIADALNVQNYSISSREAEIFLQAILGIERSQVHAHPEQELTPTQAQQFEHYRQQREANQPVAYIIGQKEFYGYPFKTDQRALIPRPETEGLIDRALDYLPGYFKAHLAENNKPCPVRILELGTGCGAIAVTLALELVKKGVPATIIATDIASEALELAQENWQALTSPSLSRIQFIQADLFTHDLIKEKAPYDLIIANLPYVPTTWQFDPAAQPEVVFAEPDIALFGGEDGLAIYRRFFEQVEPYLKEEGRILIEYGEDQTPQMLDIIEQKLPSFEASVHQDYAELDRVLEIKSRTS